MAGLMQNRLVLQTYYIKPNNAEENFNCRDFPLCKDISMECGGNERPQFDGGGKDM